MRSDDHMTFSAVLGRGIDDEHDRSIPLLLHPSPGAHDDDPARPTPA